MTTLLEVAAAVLLFVCLMRLHGWFCDPQNVPTIEHVGQVFARIAFGKRWRERGL